jgi:creatinine amidohydrolase
LRADQLRALAERNAIVVLPLGALEQHGPHLPVEVDSMLGETIALRTARLVAAAGTPIVVLPMFWPGVSEHHMSFGGTITLDIPTYAAVVEQMCRSVQRHGFKRVVLLNAHGGNENPLRAIVDDLTPKLGLVIVQFTYWYAVAAEIAAILEKQTALLHACEAETAMMMASLAHANTTPDVSDVVGGGVYRWRAIASRSGSGVIGHPEAASAEKGERLYAAISEALAKKLLNPELWDLPWQ